MCELNLLQDLIFVQHKGVFFFFTLQGVLGMARMTVVVGVVQDWSCSIVTPAQILTRSLSVNAS